MNKFLMLVAILSAPIAASAATTGDGIIGPINPNPTLTCAVIDCPDDISSVNFYGECVPVNSSGTTRPPASAKCFNSHGVLGIIFSCSSCTSGKTLVSKEYIMPCDMVSQHPITYTGCDCVCTNCKSTAWENTATDGYQKQIERKCNCDSGTPICKETTKYRCSGNYYGTTTDGTTGCTRCDRASGFYTDTTKQVNPLGTTDGGKENKTDCYIPTDKYYDYTGELELTNRCYWKN